MRKRLFLLGVLIFCISMTVFSGGQQAKFPASNITIICPFGTGGTVDLNARLLAAKMSEIMGVQVNVVNKTGGNGEIGSLEIKNAKTDGYTVGVFQSTDTVLAETLKGTISVKDYDWICQISASPYIISVKPNSPFRTIQDVVAYAKKNPGSLTVAETGNLAKLFALMWADQAGIEISFVNFPSGAESCSAMLGGHVEVAILTPQYIGRVKAGGGKTLSTAGDGLSEYPEIVTMKSLGYDVEAVANTPTFVLPKGVGADIVQYYKDSIAKIGQDEAFKKSIKTAGFYGDFVYGDAFTKMFNAQAKVAGDALAKNIHYFK